MCKEKEIKIERPIRFAALLSCPVNLIGLATDPTDGT
jgi:hypothetical protein